ncbi:hypothetical protein [Leptolyngbya ohadii]|uniref:hypothetical protein n=1 Tax=Leptolyngbya ohadii TaxID=1962290 RepID=UPI00117AC7DB|nr:hypothetical protein [Leptolyngbya ohadii]
MLIRANSAPIASPTEPISSRVSHSPTCKVSNIVLFLLLAAGFVTTAKVLVSPFVTPVPPSHPELATQLTAKNVKTVSQSTINCPPAALAACLTE